MTTHTAHHTTRWTRIMRFFAPGPYAIGMHLLIHPILWKSPTHSEGTARGAQR